MDKSVQQKVYVFYILFLIALAFYLLWVHLGHHTGDSFRPNAVKDLYNKKKGLYLME